MLLLPPRADRKSLLLGTAIVSTLLVGCVLTPFEAHAQDCTALLFPSGVPIVVGPSGAPVNAPINCNNTETRTSTAPNFVPFGGSVAIGLVTDGDANYIKVKTDSLLTATTPAGSAIGIVGITGGFGSGTGAGAYIDITNGGDIVVATDAVAGANGGPPVAGILGLAFGGPGSFIDIDNSGGITLSVGATTGANVVGIGGTTFQSQSGIDIQNAGDVSVSVAAGIGDPMAPLLVGSLGGQSQGNGSAVEVVNVGGDLTVSVGAGSDVAAFGMFGQSFGADAPVRLENRGGTITVTSKANNAAAVDGLPVAGILGLSFGASGFVDIDNDGKIVVTADDALLRNVVGVGGTTLAPGGGVEIENRGDVSVSLRTGNNSTVAALGSQVAGAGSHVDILNEGGDLKARVGGGQKSLAIGLFGQAIGPDSSIRLENRGGDIEVAATGGYSMWAYGIHAQANGAGTSIDIKNSGDIAARGAAGTTVAGIRAAVDASSSPIAIQNSGDIDARAGGMAVGILALSNGGASPIRIDNDGDVVGENIGTLAFGNGAIAITNSGQMTSLGGSVTNLAPFPLPGIGIFAIATGEGDIVIDNKGRAEAFGTDGWGITAAAVAPGTRATVINSGSAYGAGAGVVAAVNTGATIVNSGDISAGNQRAIYAFEISPYVQGGSVDVFNAGRITGFVELGGHDDSFVNQSGGVFETKLVSDFGGGHDLFRNEAGGTVQAATDPGAREHSTFVNLERFENAGTISLQDGQVGDTFEISNTVGHRNLTFAASSGSTLAVDASLGGSGSQADNLIVNGNITGKTALAVRNTNSGPGQFGAVIPVVYANGDVKSDAFFLSQPIDTGFFDYDLFFRPTGSGIFELRSFLGAGAFVLPQLTTAAQDLWHAGSSTWFDRTADLRVLLAGGAAPTAYAPTGSKLDDGVQAPSAVPAVWMRGGGSWLDRDDSESVTAYGRTYQYNLDRELETFDFQVGLDLGTRDVLGSGDILVFGALGGFVHGDLGYEQIARGFDLSGGQVGGYATYLNGRLFVDTLLNAHFLEVDTPVLGFPGSLDATTIGLRTDAGYRFGSFTGGAFIEPLATIAVTWADLDGFNVGGNTVSFDDDANVRGRLGLRAGTSYAAWEGVVIEPFVIGSLWGNLSGDTNSATLTSNGTTFLLNDQLDDVWGEVSAGVNFFNFSSGTTLFAKVDVTFGDDISGVGGKLGMRVAW